MTTEEPISIRQSNAENIFALRYQPVMETGFLNPIHDEEHFSSTFYNQGNVLEESEHILFGEMIVPEIIDYDNLWPPGDETCVTTQGEEKNTSTQKEKEFKKLLFEWQHQLNYMQEPEAIKQIVEPLGSTSTQEVSEMFPNTAPASSTPSVDPSIDELFPLETNNKGLTFSEVVQNNRDHHCIREDVAFKTRVAALESPIKVQLNSKLASDKTSVDEGVKTAAMKIKEEPKIRPRIKVEIEEEREKEVDIETVGGEEIPLLMAGDLTSLLEQFEATEKVNATGVHLSPSPPSPPRPSSQTIRDALPKEVINRIKATRENHKKIISVIPAMPNKRPGRAATRMQDAGATLSRNKLLKLVTGGESVQLDHDYCTNGGDSTSNSSRSCYMSDSSEYPSQSSTPDTSLSRMPDFKIRVCDTGSRKDSGLESGENSDEDVSPNLKSNIVMKRSAGLKSVHLVNENGIVMGKGATSIRNNIPMVSVLKKNIQVEDDSKEFSPSAVPVLVKDCLSQVVQSDVASVKVEGEVDSQVGVRKKKKLNLEEYRVRREERERFRSQESSRANSPVPCPTPPVQPDSTTSVGSQEGLPKEKPLMLSVEVQTQTSDFIDLTSSKSSKEHERSRIGSKEKRNDLRNRSYQSWHASSSSSSSSADSDRHRSYRKKRSSRKRSRSRSRRRSSVSRMWSRSPSHSSSGSESETSSPSRSRSRSRERRQKWRSRSPRRSHRYESSRSCRSDRDRSWQRSRSPLRAPSSRIQDFPSQEKVRQVEERRVIYVGRIDEGTTKADLRKRFQQFGPIVDISVHFRERGDNYGFVTFAYKADAYKAVEHGNDDPKLPRYDLCFGGRRAFCKQRYADLDGLATTGHCQYGPPATQPRSDDSFDLLLSEVKAQLRKRSAV